MNTLGISAIFVLGLSCIYWVAATRHWQKRAELAEAKVALWEPIATQRHAVAHNFLNACRLIAIYRNGRLNVFTFARGDTNFTIETMGLLSDTPQTWREQAGLK